MHTNLDIYVFIVNDYILKGRDITILLVLLGLKFTSSVNITFYRLLPGYFWFTSSDLSQSFLLDLDIIRLYVILYLLLQLID